MHACKQWQTGTHQRQTHRLYMSVIARSSVSANFNCCASFMMARTQRTQADAGRQSQAQRQHQASRMVRVQRRPTHMFYSSKPTSLFYRSQLGLHTLKIQSIKCVLLFANVVQRVTRPAPAHPHGAEQMPRRGGSARRPTRAAVSVSSAPAVPETDVDALTGAAPHEVRAVNLCVWVRFHDAESISAPRRCRCPLYMHSWTHQG